MRLRHSRVCNALILLAPLCVASCATDSRRPLAPATLLPEREPPPRTVKIPVPVPLPGQLKTRPSAPDAKAAAPSKAPVDVVADANHKATASPDPDGYFNAIMTYDYAPGGLYQIYSAVLRITSLDLEPGEHLAGNNPVAIGDQLRWKVGYGVSGPQAKQQWHVYLKPVRANLSTSLIVATDRRTYHLELVSTDGPYMAAVQWRYQDDDLPDLATAVAAAAPDPTMRPSTATTVDLASTDCPFRITVREGSPTWAPTKVCNDATKTYILFPPAMATREAPVLFVLPRKGAETEVVSYRVKPPYYVVDRLLDLAELRIAYRDHEDVVRIERVSR